MSDTDGKYTLPAKMEKYLRNGVRLEWMIDPFTRQTTVFRPDRGAGVVSFAEIVSGDTVLPGFALTLNDFL